MSPKVREGKAGILLVNDHQHEELGAVDVGRDGGICTGQQDRDTCRTGTGGGLPFPGNATEGAGVPEVKEKRQGDREAFCDQGPRFEPRPSHSIDLSVDEEAQYPKTTRTPHPFCASLYGPRRGAAGRRRRGARGSIRAGHSSRVASGVHCLWEGGVRAVSGDFGFAYLQSAPLGAVSAESSADTSHPSPASVDRRAAEAGSPGQTRVPAGGHGASGTTRWPAGDLSHQRRRYGDAMASDWLRGNDLRTGSDPGVRGDVSPIPLSHSGVSQ